MSGFVEEIMAVSENKVPMPFDDAVKRIEGRVRLVFISPTAELADHRFREVLSVMPEAISRATKYRRITLTNGTVFQFLTNMEVDNGALRGIGKVIWVA